MEPAANDRPTEPRPKDEQPMSRATLVAVAGLLVALAALALATLREREEPNATVSAPVPTTVAAQPQPDQREPSFDVVRIGNDGNAVIAGRAMPGAVVTVIDGGTELGNVTADQRGEWVFLPSGALPAGSRELRLKAVNPDGTTLDSGEPVVLVVPERGKGPALAIQSTRQGASRLLQGPGGAVSGPLSLEVVDHDDQGRLFVGGKAPPKGKVILYLDNRVLGRTEADADGAWRVGGGRPAAGNHQLRADLVDAKGKVQARVEVTWSPGEEMGSGAKGVVVAPGNSLWRIARRLYGQGVAYTVIFEANKGQIKDPNLIYPGQVFNLPDR